MRTLLFAAVLLLLPFLSAAQPAGQFQIELPIRWTDGEAREQNVAGALGVEHMLGGQRVRLFYDLDTDAFGTGASLRTWLHNGGATATWGSDRRALDVGGAVFWRANQGAWADAGFKGINLLTSLRVKPRETFTMTGSYAFYARSFPDEPALDQIEHFASWRALVNLPTRTTAVALISIGQKNYDGRVMMTTTYDPPSYGDTVRGGRGWRQGMFVPTRVEIEGAPGSRHQWTWAARLAQSLADRTGIWLELEQRRTAGDLPPAIVWTPPLFYEDGVYDDPYVIDATSWRAGAKHVFESGHELSAWASSSDRTYAGLARTDVLTRAGAEVLVPIARRRSAPVDLAAGYGFFRNRSDDPIQSYRTHQLSLGIRVAF
jgi:hypothetical protein